MPDAFDAYHKWLGIPPSEQPPNCYRLLSIALFESDPDVIASAADKQMAHIRSFQTGRHSSLSQKILNEIAAARICLLNAAKKAEYDEKLRGQLAALESQPQQAEALDPSQYGFGLTAPKSPPAAKQQRQSRAKKLPWQLPAAIGAGLLASVGVIAYLIVSNSSESNKPAMQVQAGAALHETDTSTKPNEKIPSKPEPKLEPKPPKVEPRSESEPPEPNPESKPKPKPEPKPTLKPEPDSREKVAERVKDAFDKAKTAADFRAVAIDALKLIAQANTDGDHNVAKSVVVLALSAARKADDAELEKTATLCLLEPAKVHPVTDEPAIGGTARKVYLDDLEESGAHVGFGSLGKHGDGCDGAKITVGGLVPVHALLAHAPSSISYHLDAPLDLFRATVTIRDAMHASSKCTFQVRGDGRLLWESRPIDGPGNPQECNISVRGVRVLILDCVNGASDNGGAQTIWVEPHLLRSALARRSGGLPVPDAASQEKALKLVREVFKDGYSATTSEKQKAVAQELLEKALAENNDAATRYVMLREAGRFAVKAKDADLAQQIVEEMGTRFEVDVSDLNAKALMAIGKSLRSNEPFNALVDSLLALMKEAVTMEKFDAAKQLGTAAVDVARKSRDSAFIKETAAREGTIAKELPEIRKAQAEVVGAVEALDKNPIDPAANVAVGAYRCFLQGNWNRGISMLALGDDPALKDLALKELNGVTDATEQASLGDAWWDLGEKKNGLARKNIQGHAASCYQQALPGLAGLVKEKVEKRVASISTGNINIVQPAMIPKNGFVQTGNVALATNGTTVKGVTNSAEALLDGKSDYTTGWACTKWPCEWIISFNKAYRLEEIRFLLYAKDTPRFYRYSVAVSVDGKTFVPLADRSQGEWRAWQTIRFHARPIVAVKLNGLYNSANPWFDVVEFEAYCVPPKQ